jgi:hypothetical protein
MVNYSKITIGTGENKKKLFCSHSLAFTSIIDGNEGSESFSLHMGLMYIKQYMCEQNLNG